MYHIFISDTVIVFLQSISFVTDLSSSPSLPLSQEGLYPLHVLLLIVDDAGVPVRIVPDPQGAPVVTVALK